MTKEQKQLIAEEFENATFHKDGTVSVKQSFFYTHGFTSSKFAQKVLNKFPNANILLSEEHWNNWPKTSYWLVKFKLPSVPV